MFRFIRDIDCLLACTSLYIENTLADDETTYPDSYSQTLNTGNIRNDSYFQTEKKQCILAITLPKTFYQKQFGSQYHVLIARTAITALLTV